MEKDEYLKHFAASLRAAADLVERGMLERVEAQIDYEHVAEPDRHNFTMRTRATGRQTVTIKLTGNPRDMRETGWSDERTAVAAPVRKLPRTCRHGTILYGAKCLRCERGET